MRGSRFGSAAARMLCPLAAAVVVLATVRPAAADDWPMLAHDAGRSGATAEEVKPPVKRAWGRYFHLEGLMPSVQPVVAGDRVYLGTMAGNFYCLGAADGKDVWVRKVGGPVFHTACVTPEGLVVFGAGDGAVYALRSQDGQVAWKFQTAAPLWNSPVAHDRRLYLGGRDGRFYALSAADGALAWQFDAGAPICQSPALDAKRGAVYFTSEDMVVHALAVADGKERWRSERLPGVTARSFYPVVAPDGTVMTNTTPIYNWDRCHRPLDRANDALFGTEELAADATRAAGRYVRLPSWRHTKETNKRFDESARKIMQAPDFFRRATQALQREIQQDPATQCLFLLDPETGRPRAVAPVVYTAFAKSEFTPPLAAPGGKVLTKWCIRLPGTWTGYQPEVNVATIDPATGEMGPVFDESRIDSGKSLGLIADESCQLSVTGRYLLNLNNHHGENLNFFDRSDPERRTFGQYYTTHTHWYGVGIVHRLLRGELDRIDAGQEDLIAGLGDLGYATGNHPCANMPAVAAGGRLFYAGSNKLMALAPAQAAPTFSRAEEIADYGIAPLTEAELKTLYDTWPINWDRVRLRPPDGKWDDLKCHTPAEITYPPGTRANPDEAAAHRADAIADDLLDRYVWEWPVPGALPADAAAQEMRTQLAAAVKELVAQPLWMPYRFQGGKHPSDSLLLYEDPADMLYALALAYPWLEESLQVAAKAYVARQWPQADPVMTLDRYRPDQGSPREFYTVPAGGVEARVFSTGTRRRGPERAYAAWLWAQNTGDWESIRPLWPTLRKAHEWTQASAERDWKNAYTAGLIAACRMAKHFGDAEALEKLLPAARQALRQRIALEWRFSRGNLQGRLADTLWTTWTRWVFLSPEVGRAVREQAGEGAVRLARTHLDVIGPFWYLNWGPVAPTGLENATQLPINVMAGFMAKAYLEGAPAPALRTYADIPACRGDGYWIQRLAIALNASSQPEWRQAR